MNEPKIILMPLATSGQIANRMQGALSVAAYFQSHLEVLHTQVSPRAFLPDETLGMSEQMVRDLEVVADRYAAMESTQLRQQLEALCQQASIPLQAQPLEGVSAAWHSASGLRSTLVAEQGKLADLIILPRPRDGRPTATFEAAVMETGRPVLLVPRTMTQFVAERIVVAWNGSTESARALAQALPFLARARSVVVTSSTQVSKRRPDASAVCDYLAWRGIEASVELFDSHHEATGKSLLRKVEELEAELLVMGGYSQQRLQERILGGVTYYVLNHAQLPVLMAH